MTTCTYQLTQNTRQKFKLLNRNLWEFAATFWKYQFTRISKCFPIEYLYQSQQFVKNFFLYLLGIHEIEATNRWTVYQPNISTNQEKFPTLRPTITKNPPSKPCRNLAEISTPPRTSTTSRELSRLRPLDQWCCAPTPLEHEMSNKHTHTRWRRASAIGRGLLPSRCGMTLRDSSCTYFKRPVGRRPAIVLTWLWNSEHKQTHHVAEPSQLASTCQLALWVGCTRRSDFRATRNVRGAVRSYICVDMVRSCSEVTDV